MQDNGLLKGVVLIPVYNDWEAVSLQLVTLDALVTGFSLCGGCVDAPDF